MKNEIAPSVQVIRDAVRDAVRNGRPFHDYWFYVMTEQQQALFDNLRKFEDRAQAAYKREIERKITEEERRSSSTEYYWKEKQGDEYGSF